ncbi:MAG: type I methionyl aminopeptidase [Thermodesulfovibrionales bacterium]
MVVTSERDKGNLVAACRIVAQTLGALRGVIREGVTTKELDLFAEEFIRTRGGIPAFKGYRGYPASVCTSINSQVVHGIPSAATRLKEGDIVSVDLGVVFGGLIGDAAITFPVGRISELAEKLIAVTEESLWRGIERARTGKRVSDISAAVQETVESNGFSVVRAFVGHGLGRSLHEEPQIPNYVVKQGDAVLKRGMVLAIEPMVNAGGYEVYVQRDGWTAVTVDGSLSAHFEHTVIVGDGEAEVLTKM